MDLTIYDIIQGPVVSDKAYQLNQKFKKLFLNVHQEANKPMVKEVLEKLFNVKVKSVRIMVRKGKNRMVRRRAVAGSDQKRAIVTLAEGYSLNFFEQMTTSLPEKQATPKQ
jgi:large subunit ribosomal protein L23